MRKRLQIAGLFVGAALFANAGPIWSTPAGPPSATAAFTFGAGTVTIVLTDTTTNPANVADNLSAFSFSLTNGTAISLASGSVDSATERTVAGDGSFSVGPSLTTGALIGWVPSGSAGSYELDVLTGTGHAGPSHTLIGAPGGATYAAANNSIAGNGPHNPFLAVTMTLVLNITGVTSTTNVTAASFQFGTTDGSGIITGSCTSNCTVPPSEVPEPTTLSLGAAGLAGIALLGLRRKRLSKGTEQ